ncbi:MAG: serine protease [Pirellulales bacterium]|nr:serine protease [Pirellulales bacterium]
MHLQSSCYRVLMGLALCAGSVGQSYGAPSGNAFADLTRIWQAEFGQLPDDFPLASLSTDLLNYMPGVDRRPNQPHPAVVRVIVPEQGATSYGSGTLVDVRENFGLVITNWHVVRDARGPVEVVFPGGFTSKARALKVDADWDLAALVVWRPDVQPVKIAARAPRPGDPLTICGYGQGMYRMASGRCTQYYAPRQDFPQQMVELDVEARQGDSGGPIFNSQGELAGVLFGAGQGTTLGSFGGRVDSFLATLAPDIGLLAEGAALSTNRETDSIGAPPVGEESLATCSRSNLQLKESQHPESPSVVSIRPDGEDATSAAAWSSTWPEDVLDTTVSLPAADEMARSDAAGWQPVASDSLFEQLKTALAAVGLLAIAVQVLRVAR